MRIKLIAVGIQFLDDNPDTKTTHSYRWKTTKTQWTGIRLMAADTQKKNFSSRAETSCSHPQGMKKTLQMGKSLKTASTLWTNFGLMAVSQRTTKPRVVVEQQTDVCLKATSVQRTDPSLMAVLQ